MPSLHDLTEPAPPPGPADWNADGYVIAKGLIPDGLIDAYRARWEHDNGAEWPPDRPHGYGAGTPYRQVRQLRELCMHGPLAELLESLIGEPAGLHLNLTGWVTTERDWHQDTYLNPPEVGDSYAAVWIALEDIHPDSGPLQLVPGSHRWRTVTQARMLAHLEPHERTDPNWPKYSERLLTGLFEAEIARCGATVHTHLPSRGDVLVWHPRLVHRGSRANVAGRARRACIAHYSGVHHRPDMPAAVPSGAGWVFPL